MHAMLACDAPTGVEGIVNVHKWMHATITSIIDRMNLEMLDRKASLLALCLVHRSHIAEGLTVTLPVTQLGQGRQLQHRM